MRHKELWRDVRKLHDGLTFTQKVCEQAFGIAEVHCSKNVWPRALTSTEQSEWKVSLAKQFRACCRHITQSHKTAWYRQIFDKEADITLTEDPDKDEIEVSRAIMGSCLCVCNPESRDTVLQTYTIQSPSETFGLA